MIPHETIRKGPPREAKNRLVHSSEVQPGRLLCWSFLAQVPQINCFDMAKTSLGCLERQPHTHTPSYLWRGSEPRQLLEGAGTER